MMRTVFQKKSRAEGMDHSDQIDTEQGKAMRYLSGLIVRAMVAGVACVALAGSVAAQTSDRHYALINARIETVTNGVIDRGTLVMRDGRIEALGADVTVPEGADVIDCSGGTIYPGMIDGGTLLGLIEISSLDETRDNNESMDLTPQAQALTAVNPNSVSIPVTRVNGVTTVLTTPTGGLLSGTAALINLYGYTPEQMSVEGTKLLRLNFPSRARHGWWDRRSEEEIDKTWRSRMEKLDEVWDRAELYASIDSAWHAGDRSGGRPEYVPEIDAMLPAIRREMLVMVEVNRAEDIDTAIAWIRKRNVRAVLTGVEEGWRVADHIAEAGLPCIVGPVLTIPTRGSDRYDKAYANPGLLRKAGVDVALRTDESANVRNLPFNAGFAAAYGLGREEALRSVTIVPATIFGVDHLLGSLEVGKQATLFVADGDPFEPATNVDLLFINGWNVPTTSRHTELNEEFLHRKP